MADAARLAAAGWHLARFTWAQVVRRPGYVATVIGQLLASLDDQGRA